MLWQLKKLSTNEPLNEPGELPVNWGPIFGLAGIEEKLGDLSWLGDNFSDMGWVQVEGTSSSFTGSSEADLAWQKAKVLLQESDWSMLSDVPMLNEEKERWIAYRKALREIRMQPNFPINIVWPIKPE